MNSEGHEYGEDEHEGLGSSDPRLIRDRQWVWAYAPEWSAERDARRRGWDRSGKWLIFLDSSEVTKAWSTIVWATTSGALGFRAKVSTAMESRFGFKDYVIAVYNEDADDAIAVRELREKLKELGFGVDEKLFYKREATTQAGIYHGMDERSSSMVL
jgi:hypothetical protein